MWSGVVWGIFHSLVENYRLTHKLHIAGNFCPGIPLFSEVGHHNFVSDRKAKCGHCSVVWESELSP